MKRLGPLGASLFAAVGIVAAIALLPASRWSFRNQIDVLSAPSKWSGPAWDTQALRNNPTWDLTNREESLARAFALRVEQPNNTFGPQDRYVERPWFRAFREHEDRFPKDVEALAGHARLLCMSPMSRPADDARKNTAHFTEAEIERQVRQRTETATALLGVTTRGIALDPDNLYFALSRAMALNVLGRAEEARRQILAAAELKRYEDYAVSEGVVTIRAVERRLGYRGESFRTSILASILLPHFASMKGIVREMLDHCPADQSLRLQWALYRINHTVARESSTYIGILVGRAGMALALARPDEFKPTKKKEPEREEERQAFLRGRAEAMRDKLAANAGLKAGEDPVRMIDEATHLFEVGRKTIDTADDPLFSGLYRWTSLAAKALLGFASLLCAVPGFRMWARRSPQALDRARGALAVAMSLLIGAIAANADTGTGSLLLLIGALLMVILAILLARERSIRPLALALPTTGILLTISGGLDAMLLVAGLAIGAVGAAWLASRTNWAASVLALLASGLAIAMLYTPGVDAMGLMQFVPFALLAGCLLMAAPARWFEHSAAIVAIGLVGAYAYFVLQDVSDNSRLRVFNPRFVNEAARVRKEAGLPRLSQETENPLPN